MKARGDNVGQSGRWRRADGTENDEVSRRYGKEESHHSTDHPVGAPHEDHDREPNAEKPISTHYQGRSASRGEGEQGGTARYPSSSYADAGGDAGQSQPAPVGSAGWEDQGGAGHGEGYGVGRDPDESKANEAPPSEKK